VSDKKAGCLFLCRLPQEQNKQPAHLR